MFLDWRAKGGGALPESGARTGAQKKKGRRPTLDDVPQAARKNPSAPAAPKNLQKLLNTLEREISQLETQSSDLEQQMVDAASDSGKLLGADDRKKKRSL